MMPLRITFVVAVVGALLVMLTFNLCMIGVPGFTSRLAVPVILSYFGLVVLGSFAILLWPKNEIPANHCLECGYNLEGNTSGVCPECGTKVAGES